MKHLNETNFSSKNDTQPTSDRILSTKTDDLIVASIWMTLLFYALIANTITLIGIVRSQTLLKTSSYLLIVSLAFCDICMALISIVHIVPATIWHSLFLDRLSWRNITFLFLYNFFWYTGVLKLAAMSLNRFVSIVLSNHYKSVFTRCRTFQIIGFTYLAGFSVSVPTLFPCCQMVWDSRAYMADFAEPPSNYMLVDFAVNSISLVIMIISYVTILWRVRESGRALARYKDSQRRKSSLLAGLDPHLQLNRHYSARTKTKMMAFNPAASLQYHFQAHLVVPRPSVSKREIRLFIQFFVVSMVFLSTWVAWQSLVSYTTSKWVRVMFTSLFFVNNGVNPTVYFIFNTSLRREIRKMFCDQTESDQMARSHLHRRPIHRRPRTLANQL